MTTELTSKQTYEAYAISFDFAARLGAETIASVTVSAIDQTDQSDVSLTLLDPAKQSNTNTVVYLWVRAGTSGHGYLITVRIVGSGASQYELEAILPVQDIPPAGTTTGDRCILPPSIEPVTLAEAKMHLRLDSETLDGNLTITQCLAYASHAIANDYTTHVGTAVDVLGKQAEVLMHHGTNGATGTVDTKIQESDDGITWTDWTGGAFTQVTTANDNADYKKAYTGTKQYVRTTSKVLLAACEFGTSILVNAATTAEDALLTAMIQAARERVEDITRRALLTQTWQYVLQSWPAGDYIKLPFGNLQSVSSVKYIDTDGTTTTMTATTDYLVEANGEGIGRIVLPYGESWPGTSLYPSNPITIEFICGWTAAANIPSKIRIALLMILADLWDNREAQAVGQFVQVYSENRTAMALLQSSRLWDEF